MINAFCTMIEKDSYRILADYQLCPRACHVVKWAEICMPRVRRTKWPVRWGCAVLRRSVASDSSWPRGPQPTGLLCPWGFFRQEYWSGLSCPPPGDLPNLGIEPGSPALRVDFAHSLPAELPGKPRPAMGRWPSFLVQWGRNQPD